MGSAMSPEDGDLENAVLILTPSGRDASLAAHVLEDPAITDQLRIPMLAGRRSLNLANAASIAVYEAWRQHGYAGISNSGTYTPQVVVNGRVAGVSHEPPTHATLGRARYSGADAAVTPPVGQNTTPGKGP